MKNSKALFSDFVNQLNLGENKEEVQSIAFLVFENLFGLSREQIMTGKEVSIPSEWLQEISRRLNSNEPVQYILNEAFFYGRRFKVSPAVLIPRPETEELVQYVIGHSKQLPGLLRIVDIGTGSGCIPITLSLELPGSEIIATDISREALKVAKENNDLLHASVKFIHHNILKDPLPVTDVDIIVSNPPYISDEEKKGMKNNVLSFEPHLALFVDGNDPLLFYKKIVRQAKKVLRKQGMVCVEINEHFGKEMAAIFEQSGFKEITVIRDLQGKERIISGILTS